MASLAEMLGGKQPEHVDSVLARQLDPSRRYKSLIPSPFEVMRKLGLNIPDWSPTAQDAAEFLPGAGVVESQRMGAALPRLREQGDYGGYLANMLAAGAMAGSELLPGIMGSTARKGIKAAVDSPKWYRGVSGDYPLRRNTMWTTDPAEAGEYARGVALTNTGEAANVIPATMKPGRGRNIDDEIMEAFMDGADPDNVAANIIAKEGLDYVEFYHPSAVSQEDHLVRMVLDPENIVTQFD